jgi:hypothetical protein
MAKHNLPCLDGKDTPPLLTASSSHPFGCMAKADPECPRLFVDRYLEERPLHFQVEPLGETVPDNAPAGENRVSPSQE